MLNPRLLLAVSLLSACFLTACASKKPGPPSNINGFPPEQAASHMTQIRMAALQDTATSLGAQSGLAWAGKQLNESLEHDERNLNQVYNFNALLINGNVLPPVLSEGRNALNVDDSETLRLADKVYKIESPPRFVTAAPTWREYLWMNYETPEKPNATLLPRDDEERKMWNEAVLKGWNDGTQQANQIFSENMGRLKRDYNGMILYRKLLNQNIVTAPFVAKSELGVTGDDTQIRVNDQVLRITATSKLVPDSKQWKPAVVPGVEGALRTQGTEGTQTRE
jgi:defect-in-organelle-trafficking protein DotC